MRPLGTQHPLLFQPRAQRPANLFAGQDAVTVLQYAHGFDQIPVKPERAAGSWWCLALLTRHCDNRNTFITLMSMGSFGIIRTDCPYEQQGTRRMDDGHNQGG